MPYCVMLRRVALVKTVVSKEHFASTMRVTRISEQRKTLAVRFDVLADACHVDDGGVKFLRNVGLYKNHNAKHPRRWYASYHHVSLMIHTGNGKAHHASRCCN
jgi:hypothetical protein